MGNYFLVEVKPTIPGSNQTSAFADGDVIFNWFAFDIPRGGAKLVSAQMVIRGTDATSQTALDESYELYFAKDLSSGTTPGNLGTPNGSAGGIGFYNNIIGAIKVDGSETTHIDKLHLMTASGTGDSGLPLVLQGEPNTGSATGFDRIYVGCTSVDGVQDFSTNVFTTGAVEGDDGSVSTLTVDDDSGGGAAATRKFMEGDVLITESDIVLGTIKSLTDTVITFESGMTGGDLVDSLEIYNNSPITLQLGFEA